MSSSEWFLPNFGIPNFDLSTFKERKRYQHAAELEKKVYTSTGGTGGGHSSEERLLTLFIIDFYVMLRLFSSGDSLGLEVAGPPCAGVEIHLQRGGG